MVVLICGEIAPGEADFKLDAGLSIFRNAQDAFETDVIDVRNWIEFIYVYTSDYLLPIDTRHRQPASRPTPTIEIILAGLEPLSSGPKEESGVFLQKVCTATS